MSGPVDPFEMSAAQVVDRLSSLAGKRIEFAKREGEPFDVRFLEPATIGVDWYEGMVEDKKGWADCSFDGSFGSCEMCDWYGYLELIEFFTGPIR